MQRRFNPMTLTDNFYGTAYPAPTVHAVNVSTLNGGLNLWELDYRLQPNQSPDCENVYWNNGSLSSRPGQDYLYEETDPTAKFYACYPRVWNGYIVAHKGEKIYRIDPATGAHTAIFAGLGGSTTPKDLRSGAFFVFGDKLYYMNGVDYIQITNAFEVSKVVGYVPTVLMNVEPDGTNGRQYQPENRLSSGKTIKYTQKDHGSEVATFQVPTGYYPIDPTPMTILAYDPAAGMDVAYTEIFEAETSIGFPQKGYEKIIYHATDTEGGAYPNGKWYHWYSSGGTSGYAQNPNNMGPSTIATIVQLPAESSRPQPGEASKLYHANAENTWWTWNGSEYVSAISPEKYIYSVDRANGQIFFDSDNPPQQPSPSIPNDVTVTLFKVNEDAYNSIMQCSCVTVYGSENSLAVVCGGPPAQPNAYFWSGNTATQLDPSYFPMDYYNFAGSDASEAITGFGKQQDFLVIFKERSIGKSKPFIDDSYIEGRDFLRMPYTPVNDTIGCDRPKSIQLIINNLVFANTYSGVYVLTDTTAAGENTVSRISRNVNGDPDSERGLLYDLRKVASPAVVSYDDGQRYWLCANGHVYLWDYTLKWYYRTAEEKLTWFYFTNIFTRGWFRVVDKGFYFNWDGDLIEFTQGVYADFEEPIYRKYVFATLFFDTYESMKDVLKVVFAVQTDQDPAFSITYRTDYEERKDLTDILAYGYHLVPRNLAHRSLRPIPYAAVAVRKPRCFHIRHFSMTLENNRIYTGMSIVSAQVFYRYSREER